MSGSRYAKNLRTRVRKRIAENLRDAREAAWPPLSQADAAKLFKPPLTRASISQWESGDTLPEIERLYSVAEVYGCTIEALVGDPNATKVPLAARKFVHQWLKLSRKNQLLVVDVVRALARSSVAPSNSPNS